MSETYPPIQTGTCVRATVLRSGKNDYTDEAIAARAAHHGCIGVVREHHDSHGLCYGVEFEDGVVAFFDPQELELRPRETTRPPAGFLVTLLGYAALSFVGVLLFFMGLRDAAFFASSAGTFVWTFGVLAWVVFIDSRRRWPGVSASRRFWRVIALCRD